MVDSEEHISDVLEAQANLHFMLTEDPALPDVSAILRLEGWRPDPPGLPDWPYDGMRRVEASLVRTLARAQRGRPRAIARIFPVHAPLERDERGDLTEAERVRLRRQMEARRHG